MKLINLTRLVQSFEKIVGWKYVSPGTNDENGIDCSGAFVRAYKAQGASIYHGSNTIYRKHCSSVGRINSVNDLQVGMAVFKNREDGAEPSQYKNDGMGNMYHIGLVCGVNPLLIIHATSPVAKIDTALGKTPSWKFWGKLSQVQYDVTPIEEGSEQGMAYEVTVVPSTLNMRKTAGGEYMLKIPMGTKLTVLNEATVSGKLFGQVNYGAEVGWIDLSFTTKGGEFTHPIVSDDDVTITLPRELAVRLRDALQGI